MKADASKDEMIYVSYTSVHALEKRIDIHSEKHAQMFEKISNQLAEMRKENNERDRYHQKLISEQNERITKIETERNIALKILVPIISIVVSFLTAFFSRKM